MSTTLTPPAESSTAPAVETRTTIDIPRDAGQNAHWRMTGELPTKADPAPAKETPAEGQKPEAKAAPGSESGKVQEPKEKNAETRKRELNREIDELLDRRRTLRDEVERERPKAQAAPEKAPEQTAKPAIDPKAPVKPKQSDFEGKPWQEYEDARDEYFEKLADYKAEVKVEAERRRLRDESAASATRAKLSEVKARYGDAAESTIRDASEAVFGKDSKVHSIVKAFVNESDVFVDLLYVIGEKPADLADFIEMARLNPGKAMRKVALMEQFVVEKLAEGTRETPAKDENGKFKKAEAPETKPKAPPPPHEVGGTRAAPPNDIDTATQSAIKNGDARAFIDAENRRELRLRKGH